ncbi:MAG: 4Fe-4S binding protein [Candidatus Omnitrophota bacterium]|nr:4Fe-4S binding protein [Candidatus Omnitrophota bacterium]
MEFKFFRFLKFPVIEAPYCHIALAPTIFNFFHAQFLALTSGNWHIWGFLTLGFLWLFLIFTIGQGICSWVCFYGGIDEAFSKILPKPLIKLKISKKWRDFPLAFLVFLLVISIFHGAAIFCSWFCPLKMTPSFGDNLILPRAMQIFFFVFIFGLFLILLPILTKKRTFCGFICPFGALVCICGNVSPYRVTIDKEKCTLCKKCAEICPVLAIDGEELVEKYKISSYCNKCGKCIDACPAQAIGVSILGKKEKGLLARNIFIFIALLLTGVISGNFVPQAILGLIEGFRWFR